MHLSRILVGFFMFSFLFVFSGVARAADPGPTTPAAACPCAKKGEKGDGEGCCGKKAGGCPHKEGKEGADGKDCAKMKKSGECPCGKAGGKAD